MNCEQARILMNAEIDGELNSQERSKLDQHIDSCEVCTVEFEELKYLVQTMEEMPLKPLPVGFEESLHDKLMDVRQDVSLNQNDGSHKIKRFFTKKNVLSLVGAAAVFTIIFYAANNIQLNKGYETASVDMASYDMAVAPSMENRAMEPPSGVAVASPQFTSGDASVVYEEEFAAEQGLSEETFEFRQERMIIRSANLRLDIVNYDDTLSQITRWVNDSGGFVEYASTSYKTNYTDRENLKMGYFTLRVPVDGFNNIVDQLKMLGNVISENENASDITRSYRNTADEVANLRVTEQRFREIMLNAEDISDILTIENELTRIRGQINFYERQLKDWEALVDMTTISLELNEVESLRPMIHPIDNSLFGKAKEGLIETINAIKSGFENLVIWVISYSPFIVVILIGIGIGARMLKKKKHKKIS